MRWQRGTDKHTVNGDGDGNGRWRTRQDGYFEGRQWVSPKVSRSFVAAFCTLVLLELVKAQSMLTCQLLVYIYLV